MFKMSIAARSNFILTLALFFSILKQDQDKGTIVQRVKGEYYHPSGDFMGQHISRSLFCIDYESEC